jgi:hypothetical protein
MDVLTDRRTWRTSARVALIGLIGWIGSIALSAPVRAEVKRDVLPEASVKAAFLYNFVKFADWPALPPGAPILMCVVGDDQVADALVETVRGEAINSHALQVARPPDSGSWRGCQLLFIADADMRRGGAALGGLKTAPVLTVSDGQGFSEATGIIELYVQGGRMHFAINVDTAEHAGVRLSSRLLGLAKVVRSVHAQ